MSSGQSITGAVVSFTVVVAVELLLLVSGSDVVLATVAVFDRGVAHPTFTTIVTVAEFPGPGDGARGGSVQLTVVVPVQVTPAEPVADTRVVVPGIVSDTLTPWAVFPVSAVLRLVTVIE